MEENGLDIFSELLEYHHADFTNRQRYARLNSLLDRTTKLLTADFGAEYTSLYARLFALCKQANYKYQKSIELFRLNARRVLKDEYEPNEHDYLYDFKALCEFISFFFKTPIPAEIRKLLPEGWREFSKNKTTVYAAKRIRFVVENWDEQYLYGHDEEFPSDFPIRVDYNQQNGYFQQLPQFIHTGSQLNLLDVKIDPTTSLEGEPVYIPNHIVYEPDFLIDVSSLSACVESYGTTPLNYLSAKFTPNEARDVTLLGNAANQFLDDLVNEDQLNPADYLSSIKRNFKDYMLDYSVCEGITADYFGQAKNQFNNLKKIVKENFNDASVDIQSASALLEPSFFCEPLGLQGRMDLMLSDYSRIIELKSGKANEWNGPTRAYPKHALQMALYQEFLYFSLNIPRDQVRTFLLYSKYPHLFEQRTSIQQIQEAVALRNAIVYQEQQLRNGKAWEILSSLTPDDFNANQTQGKLWSQYIYPQKDAFLKPFHEVSPLEAAYFNDFVAFTEREQFMSKMGDEQPDSGRSFAKTWNSDVLTKQANGNILINLTIDTFHKDRGIDKIVMNIPDYDDNFLPNFREGDMVMLYERNSIKDMATNHIVHRCCIERIWDNKIELRLNYQQRNPIVFPEKSLYALEHDHMDASTNSIYRGLYQFLKAPQDRKDLILCQREPRFDYTKKLQGKYTNEVINRIVLQAKRALDYFLLVGPPGTGKTSVALKSMVQEFYGDSYCNILLMSYTNRAVDEICEMLESIQPKPSYLRIGKELSCEPRFRSHLLKNQTEKLRNREQIRSLFQQNRIIVGTVSSLGGQLHTLFKLKHFNVAIIDEASQILEPQLLGILSAVDVQGNCAIEKFIMVGDHKQLPAVVVQRPEQSQVTNELLLNIGLKDKRNSLFERLYTWQLENQITGSVSTLLRQGRMHPEVADFANKHFYHGELLPVPVPHQQESLEFSKHGTDFQEYVATTRFGFLHCDYPKIEENNKSNIGEAKIVAAIVGNIYELCKLNKLEFEPAKRIGIIVPFRGQIAMIKKELAKLPIPNTEEIVIDTVERFQGSQRDIMIFSATISQKYQLNILSAPVEIEGQQVDRKLNVALTRAKKQMFIIGNEHLLKLNPLYRDLIKRGSTSDC